MVDIQFNARCQRRVRIWLTTRAHEHLFVSLQCRDAMNARRAILHRVTLCHRRLVISHGTVADKQCSLLPVMGARRNVWGVDAGWCVCVVGDDSTAVSEWRVVFDPEGCEFGRVLLL